MNRVFADTGYWIALLNPRDELHRRAREVSATLPPDIQIVTSEWVLTELLNNFAERGERLRTVVSEVLGSLKTSADTLVVGFPDAPFHEAFQLYRERQDQSWSLTDCSSFSMMKQYGIAAALSYARHFEQAGCRAMLRTDPQG